MTKLSGALRKGLYDPLSNLKEPPDLQGIGNTLLEAAENGAVAVVESLSRV